MHATIFIATANASTIVTSLSLSLSGIAMAAAAAVVVTSILFFTLFVAWLRSTDRNEACAISLSALRAPACSSHMYTFLYEYVLSNLQ